MAGLRDREAPTGEYRLREHLWSKTELPFDGTSETIPFDVGDKYDERPIVAIGITKNIYGKSCLLYTSPSPRDKRQSRMPSSA